VRTDENVETVQLLVMCQEENLRATEQFHVRRDPSIITFPDYSQRSASQVLQEEARSTAD